MTAFFQQMFFFINMSLLKPLNHCHCHWMVCTPPPHPKNKIKIKIYLFKYNFVSNMFYSKAKFLGCSDFQTCVLTLCFRHLACLKKSSTVMKKKGFMEQSPKIVLPHFCNPHRQYNIHYYCISLVCPWTHLENIADTCWEHTSFSQAYKNVLTVMHKCTWVLLPLNKLIIKLGDIHLYATNIWLVSQWQNMIALLRRTQRHLFI